MISSGYKARLPLIVRTICVFFFLAFSLSGCLTIHNLNVRGGNGSSPPPVPVAINTMEDVGADDEPRQPVPISEMSASAPPPQYSLGATSKSYLIQPGDRLEIKFFYNQQLNESVIVRPDGRISLQLIQDVQAEFLSPNELRTVLARKYATHLKNPEITVILREMEGNKIYVDGQVRASGGVRIYGYNMSIMDAIAHAGGLRDTARRDEVLLIRRNGLKKPFVYIVNLAAAMDGSDISQNVMLKPHDIVYVPKSAIANVNTWVDMYIRRNIPVNVNLDSIRVK